MKKDRYRGKALLKMMSWVASLGLFATLVSPAVCQQQTQKETHGQPHAQFFAENISSRQWDLVAFLSFVVISLLLVGYFRRKKRDVIHDMKPVVLYIAILITAAAGIFGATGILVNTGVLLGAMLSIFAVLMHEVVQGRNAQEEWLIEARFIARGASNVRTFDRWDRDLLCKIISTAKTSIEVFDSNCSEHFFWAARVQEALENGAKELDFSLSMLDPRKPFGAQRKIEMPKSETESKTLPNHRSVTPQIVAEYEDKYRDDFIHNCNNLRQALAPVKEKFGQEAVSLRIYAYPTMPCLRIIVLDKSKYIFGWFPLNDLNPGHVCFFLDGSSFLTESDSAAIRCLKHEIGEIEKDSTEIPLDKDVSVDTLNNLPA